MSQNDISLGISSTSLHQPLPRNHNRLHRGNRYTDFGAEGSTNATEPEARGGTTELDRKGSLEGIIVVAGMGAGARGTDGATSTLRAAGGCAYVMAVAVYSIW